MSDIKNEYKKVMCPNCGLPSPLVTKHNIDFQKSKSDSKVWCSHCKRWIVFSMKQDAQ